MEQGVIDENASSRKLKQQMERIKEKSESVNQRIQNGVDEAEETEIALHLLLREGGPGSPSAVYWRLTTERLAMQLDELREENLKLENSINTAMTKLMDARDENERLLGQMQCFDEDFGSDESIPLLI